MPGEVAFQGNLDRDLVGLNGARRKPVAKKGRGPPGPLAGFAG